jgi:transposase-like protein
MLTAALQAALQAEVDAYIAAFAEERDENGRRLVVRNGSHAPRKILTAAGMVKVKVKAPRVNEQAHRRAGRRAAAVLLGDPADLGA